jgi:hypothetical protein
MNTSQIKEKMGTRQPRIQINDVYQPSEKIIAREIEGAIIIVPIESGIVDIDDALYSLNETGHAVWNLLDHKKSVKTICSMLCDRYDAPAGEIERDVFSLLEELLRLKIITRS